MGGGLGVREERPLLPPAGTVRAAEGPMSTLAVASIASIITCQCGSMPVIAFIARCTREYPVRKAGMERAVCEDAGRVQMCVCGQPWAVGVRKGPRGCGKEGCVKCCDEGACHTTLESVAGADSLWPLQFERAHLSGRSTR